MSSTGNAKGSAFLIVAVCFLAQNCAMGLAFGSYGVLLASSESHFGISRTMAAAGASMITLAMGLLSPALGSLMQRMPVRVAMAAGAAISAAAYWGLALTDSYTVALAMYGLIGMGVVIVSLLGPVTIISRWFPTNRAKMLGIVNLPLFLFVAPYLVAEALQAYGRFLVLAGMGTMFLLLMPLLALLAERPPHSSASNEPSAESGSQQPSVSAKFILLSPAFWMLTLSVGLMLGSSSAFIVHFIPFAMAKNMSLQFASSALSIFSGAGILGILLFSWLADRIGAPITLVLTAVGQAIAWFALPLVDGPLLLLMAALMGACINAVVTLMGATLGDLFGTENVGKAMGYTYMINLPFLFAFAPVFGWAYDQRGEYGSAFFATSLLLAGAGALAYILRIMVGRNKPLSPATT